MLIQGYRSGDGSSRAAFSFGKLVPLVPDSQECAGNLTCI